MSKVKILPIEIDGKEFQLEYNRFAVKKIEQMGFSTVNVADKLTTNIELMFFGALQKNHRFEFRSVKDANLLLDKVLDEYDTENLLEMLIEMIMDTIPAFSNDENKEGKKSLKIVEK